ncbi:MAG: MmcQ/YjbR family DNA-binding protein [bacterium]
MKKLQSATSGKHLGRVRRICAALPETAEKLSHGEPTFFVRKKVYAMFANNHHNDGHIAVWLPAPFGIQEMLIASSPEKFFKPPYVGVRGWIGVELARVNDEELDFLVRQAWRLIAPKNLQAVLETSPNRIEKPVHAKDDLASILSSMLEGLPGVNVKKSANRLSFLIGKKVFAFMQRNGVVIKLPQERIKELVDKKTASFLVMGKREMKEWAVIKHKDPKEYKKDLKLFKAAMAFVSSKDID